MNRAVLLLGMGEKYLDWAGRLAYSFRTRGQYTDDIVIYGDGPIDVEAEVRDIAPIYRELFDGPQAECNMHMVRVAGGLQLIEEGYDEILYSDTDALVMRSVAPFFEGLGDKPRVQRDRTPWTLGWSGAHRGFLSLREQMTQVPAINSGHWVGTAKALEPMLRGWDEIAVNDIYGITASGRCLEQAALNAWCVRNLGTWAWIPDGLVQVGFDRPRKGYPAIVHYMASGRDFMDRDYEELCGTVQESKKD